MRFTEAQGRKVVDTSTAETVGKLDGYIVDAEAGLVVGLSLKKAKKSAETLPWANIRSFGVDAITVENEDAMVHAEGRTAALTEKRYAILGKRVLTAEGVEVGHVTDVDFDPSTGALRSLLTSVEEMDAGRLRNVGSYAVIVSPS